MSLTKPPKIIRCADCGCAVVKTSRQCRCAECQKKHNYIKRQQWARELRTEYKDSNYEHLTEYRIGEVAAAYGHAYTWAQSAEMGGLRKLERNPIMAALYLERVDPDFYF